MYKGYALQILEQKGKDIQATTAAQRATATSRGRNRESQHRYSVSMKSGCGSKFESRSQDPFWRIQVADGTKRGSMQQEKVASLKPSCGGPRFGGSRPLTAQKGVQQLENETGDHGNLK